MDQSHRPLALTARYGSTLIILAPEEPFAWIFYHDLEVAMWALLQPVQSSHLDLLRLLDFFI